MKFKINNTEWEIEEVDEAIMNNEMKNDYTLGVTIYKTQKVLLLKDQANIIKTLKYELTHIWLYEYGHAQNDETTYNYEDICEIVASSNDFINEVIGQYINKDSCYIENKNWNELTDNQKDDILKRVREQQVQILPR